jgi:hypothetical protein
MRSTHLFLMCFLGITTAASAQPAHGDEAGGTSTVSGRVFCADTNAPARMARVILQPAELVDRYDENKQMGIAHQGEAVQTALDGSFVIPHVPPGTYYVIAALPGYVSPLAPLLGGPWQVRELSDPEARKKIASTVPRVKVQANLPASLNVSLERGAAVSGTIRYDDGSPASGVALQLLVRRDHQWEPLPSNSFNMERHENITDDQGAYRISGVAGQEYLLEAQISVTRVEFSADGKGNFGRGFGGHEYSFSTYSGNTLRLKEAKPFSVKAGEELRGQDMEIPATRLHTVRGSILAQRDGHVINGGFVALIYPDDKSQASWGWVTNVEESSFQLNFVPEGDYILAVNDASDNEYVATRDPNNPSITMINPHRLRSYGPANISLHVEGDMSGVTINVPDAPGQPVQANQ